MHVIEDELIKATNYKIQRKFADRQDYLKSIFNAAQKLQDDEFDELSDEAATWLNSCVQVWNSKKDADLPDFDEIEPDENLSSEEANDPEEGEGTDQDPSQDNEDDGDEPSEHSDESDETEQLVTEAVDEVEEPEPRAKTKTKKAKKLKDDPRIPKPLKKSQRPDLSKDPGPLHYEDDAVLDKWGCIVGSKNSMALALFEKGASVREVKEKIGGTYYNILGKMQQRGHNLEKEGHVIKLTHRNEIAGPKVSSRKNKK